MKFFEVNFDGLIGPTHNYAGLSHGNVASQQHKNTIARPREAALQGLAKMKFLADLGLQQGVFPPPRRPNLLALRELGFTGSDTDVIHKAGKHDARLLAACYSASSMWAANAATVSPGPDTADGRTHFTPANLLTQFHRSLETVETAALLRAIFPAGASFAHHNPLPSAEAFSDEGAANHTRLCSEHGQPGIEIFVYGRNGLDADTAGPDRFPARQTRDASAAIARLHELDPDRTVFIRQNPLAIDSGVFHNDVACVGNQNLLLYHAAAFAEPARACDEIRRAFEANCKGPLFLIEASEDELSLADAVSTYVFNSQLVTLPDGAMAVIAPAESREHAGARAFLQRILSEANPITQVHYVDVRQSMRNGGGPACLRLRVVLSEAQLAQIPPSVLLTDERYYAGLVDWVQRHYRQQLSPADLADPALLMESRNATTELYELLSLSSLPLDH